MVTVGLVDHTNTDNSYVVMGQLGAPFGVKGWHHVRSFTQPIDNLLGYKKWYVQQKEAWVPFKVLNGRTHGQNLVAQLEGISDRDLAAQLCLSQIAVLREELPALAAGEFYWIDLEGLTVQTTSRAEVGRIEYLYHNAGTDIMVLKKEGKGEQHIPFIMHDTVLSVDLTDKVVTVDWDFL